MMVILLVMAGIILSLKPQYSRLDANYGGIHCWEMWGSLGLRGQTYNDISGFFIRDEVKHLDILKDKNGKHL
jgi:hypothetical protein